MLPGWLLFQFLVLQVTGHYKEKLKYHLTINPTCSSVLSLPKARSSICVQVCGPLKILTQICRTCVLCHGCGVLFICLVFILLQRCCFFPVCFSTVCFHDLFVLAHTVLVSFIYRLCSVPSHDCATFYYLFPWWWTWFSIFLLFQILME